MKHILLLATFSFILISCKSPDTQAQHPVIPTIASSDIKAAADTTRIRITTFSTDQTNNIFNFDSTASGWKGTLYRYQVTANNTAQVVDIRDMIPKNDWAEFSDFVAFLDIFALPDQKELEDIKLFPNPKSVRIQFELSRNDKQRVYTYDNPGAALPGSHWATDKINTFISYITGDFDFLQPN